VKPNCAPDGDWEWMVANPEVSTEAGSRSVREFVLFCASDLDILDICDIRSIAESASYLFSMGL